MAFEADYRTRARKTAHTRLQRRAGTRNSDPWRWVVTILDRSLHRPRIMAPRNRRAHLPARHRRHQQQEQTPLHSRHGTRPSPASCTTSTTSVRATERQLRFRSARNRHRPRGQRCEHRQGTRSHPETRRSRRHHPRRRRRTHAHAAAPRDPRLPAVDLERPTACQPACPYCQRPMLRVYARDGRVTCLAYGSCLDSNGRHPVGTLTIGAVSGEPYIAWADGKIQLPPEGTTP